MTRWRFIVRSLRYHWRTGLTTAAGLALATAVIVGSLLVGDSVRGSLRDNALRRLGRIDHALVAPQFFPADLAERIQKKLAGAEVIPVVLLRGAVTRPDSGATVPRVSIVGVNDAFWNCWLPSPVPRVQERQVALNAMLADELAVRPGDFILLSVERPSAMSNDTLFARKKRGDLARSLRLQVGAILPDDGVGGFRLDASSITPRNLFVASDWLTKELGQIERANGLLVSDVEHRRPRLWLDESVTGEGACAPRKTGNLPSVLKTACTLADYGLRMVPSTSKGWFIQSDRFVMDDALVQNIREAADLCVAFHARTSVYLADRITLVSSSVSSAPPRQVSYAIVAGIEPYYSFGLYYLFSPPSSLNESRSPGLNDIWLNEWTAKDLKARPGQRLDLSFLVPSLDGQYHSQCFSGTLREIVGNGIDYSEPRMVPDLEGITDARTLTDWQAPFPIDLKRITARDEKYWKKYRTAPKVFVSLDVARRMWQREPGDSSKPWVTAVHILPKNLLTDPAALAQFAESFQQTLLRSLDPVEMGMVFRPVREEALAAAEGTTDFGQLFLALSFFLVLAGAGLAAMLMRLSAEQRASQIGLLLATGFTPGRITCLLLGEGAILAGIGTLAGMLLGIDYAGGMMKLMAAWWTGPATGAFSGLHVTTASLLIGGAAGLLVGFVILGWSVRSIAKRAVLELLSGSPGERFTGPARKRLPILPLALTALAIGVALFSIDNRTLSPTVAFFCSGFALVLAGVSAVRWILLRSVSRKGSAGVPPTQNPESFRGFPPTELFGGTPNSTRETRMLPSDARFDTKESFRFTWLDLALRNLAVHPSRGLLVFAVLAGAGFIIVAVAANLRERSGSDWARKDSGAGGFALVAESSVPLPVDFSTPSGRSVLDFSKDDESRFEGVRVIPFRLSGGEDISCLNLARPKTPRVLGVSPAMIERGGFNIRTKTPSSSSSPWKLLSHTNAFGDADSVRWSLHSGLDQLYELVGEDNQFMKVRFDGLLPGSIFAGEILVSERMFDQLFPSIREPRYFLIETLPGHEAVVADALRRNLGELGLEIRTTAEILSRQAAVQNTYLRMFLVLGGLGFILGTVGLVLVLLRSALERRREFALMLAVGFSRGHLARLLWMENAVLLVAGLLCGTVSALVGVAPQMISAGSPFNWPVTAGILGGILVVGLVACACSARAATRGNLIEALREE